MTRKIRINLAIEYEFKGEILKDYLNWLDDHKDTSAARTWFAIDRFIGHDALDKFDKSSSMKIFDMKIDSLERDVCRECDNEFVLPSGSFGLCHDCGSTHECRLDDDGVCVTCSKDYKINSEK